MLAKAHHEVRPPNIQHGRKTLYENRTLFVRQNMKEARVDNRIESSMQIV
ncbi:MAG: hypothetical protein WB930_05805 [Syntrophobacteraceae bacterium]